SGPASRAVCRSCALAPNVARRKRWPTLRKSHGASGDGLYVVQAQRGSMVEFMFETSIRLGFRSYRERETASERLFPRPEAQVDVRFPRPIDLFARERAELADKRDQMIHFLACNVGRHGLT